MLNVQVMWVVQGLYTEDNGWEDLTYHDTKEEALEEAHLYDVNEPGIPHRIMVTYDNND